MPTMSVALPAPLTFHVVIFPLLHHHSTAPCLQVFVSLQVVQGILLTHLEYTVLTSRTFLTYTSLQFHIQGFWLRKEERKKYS